MPKKPMTSEAIQKERDKILNIALIIIIEKGYDSITMREIARRLNMSATKIYTYFESKDDVYLTLVVKGYDILFEETSNACACAANPEEKLRKFISAYINFSMTKTHYYELMFSHLAPKYSSYIGKPLEKNAQSKKTIGLNFFNSLIECVKDYFSENKEMDSLDIKHIAIMILSQVHGIIDLYHAKLLQEVDETPHHVINQTVDYIIETLECKL